MAGCSLMLISGFFVLFSHMKKSRPTESSANQVQNSGVNIDATKSSNNSVAPVDILRRKLPDGTYEIISTSTKQFQTSAVIWRDWIFFSQLEPAIVPEPEVEKFNVRVFAYNVKTNEKKLIFDSKDQGYESFEAYQIVEPINEVWVLENDLYVQFGSDKNVHIVWANLPAVNNFKELLTGNHQVVFKMNDTYWLESTVADGCVSHTNIRPLNTDNKKIGPEISFSDECGDGKLFIGQRKNALVVEEFHNEDPGEEDIAAVLDRVYLLSINDLTKRSLLSSEEDLPYLDADRVYYSPASDQLLLFGEDVYLYDVETDFLKKAASGISNYSVSEWTADNKACLSSFGGSEEGRYAILDVENGFVSFSDKKCYSDNVAYDTDYDYNKKYMFAQKLSDISLPAGFEFIQQ